MGYLNSWGLDKISNEELQGVMENIQKTARGLIEKIDLELEKRKNLEPTKSKLQTEIQEAKKEQKELLKKHEEKQKKKPKKENKLDSFKNKFKGKGE